MKNLLFIILLAVTFSFNFTQLSFAVCVEGPPDNWVCNTDDPNPDLQGVLDTFPAAPKTVTVLPGAGIDTLLPDNGANAIETASQGDTITVTDGDLKSAVLTIETVQGDDKITITNSSVLSTDGPCIDSSDDNDIVEIIDSELDCNGSGVDGGGDNDTIIVRGSEITTDGSSPIRGANENDIATIEDSILNSTDTAVSMGPGDDRVNLRNGAVLNGIVDCGSGNLDTVAFQMDVPEEALGFFGSRIAALVPGTIQTIEINDLTFELESCEIFLNELVGIENVRPIPTLSEWGLIAMAGVLGIAGLMVIRRRKVTA